MRYYVISDIHSNLEALEAVQGDISKSVKGEYLLVGDVVGYGADPQAVINIVNSLKPKASVAGNHDWGVLGLLSLEYFNEYAVKAILWTKGLLDKKELDYLRTLTPVFEDERFTLVHGSLEAPEEFHYIFDASDAHPTARTMKTPLCFVGHSHVPGIFYYDNNKMFEAYETKIKIDYSKKYVINVGSIGQPRDQNNKASYAIYNDEDDTVEIRRVPYDIKSAQSKILKAALPAWLASRLSEGR